MADQPETPVAAGADSNGNPPEPPAAKPAGPEPKIDKQGRKYIPAVGRSGLIYLQEGETPTQALERDAKGPKDKPPKRTSKPPKKPAAAVGSDLREIEKMLEEAFTSPAMICAAFGDEWSANHFHNQGPYLARNLVNASKHNPWLRGKLEAASAGGDAAMKLMSLLGVAGALFGYAVPPIVYWFNLPVADQARQMFNIPDRRQMNGPGPTRPHPAATAP